MFGKVLGLLFTFGMLFGVLALLGKLLGMPIAWAVIMSLVVLGLGIWDIFFDKNKR